MVNNQEKLKNPLVLIVDDVPQNIQVLAATLSREGYDIATAMTGRQALAMVAELPPDLILLDVMMPEMDGYEVCRIMRDSSHAKEIPIIFLTVKDEMEDIIRGFKAGAVDYLRKPFNNDELLARVRTHLELKMVHEALLNFSHDLEIKVEERTKELEEKNRALQEANTALKVVIRNREEDKRALEEKILMNIKELVIPLVSKLKTAKSLDEQKAYLELLESNLEKEIISPFLHNLSTKYLNLTPQELRIANFIREGKTSKEIADILNLAQRTVDFHRQNLRNKLNLDQENSNLRSYLMRFNN